jgi:hypothetical protein
MLHLNLWRWHLSDLKGKLKPSRWRMSNQVSECLMNSSCSWGHARYDSQMPVIVYPPGTPFPPGHPFARGAVLVVGAKPPQSPPPTTATTPR